MNLPLDIYSNLQAVLRIGRFAGNREYWLLKLCFVLLSSVAAFSWPPAGGVLSFAFSTFPSLLFFVLLTFSLSCWDSLVNVFGSGVPSSAGRASGARSVGVGLPSACSSLGVFRFDGECLLLEQEDLDEITFKMEDRNTTVKHSVKHDGKT